MKGAAMGEHLSYKYNHDKDELSVYFESPSKVSISRYLGGSECIYDSKFSHLEAYAKLNGATGEAWQFLKDEFAAGRADKFSDWVREWVPVGYIDADYFD
jgi:hypothetical protein